MIRGLTSEEFQKLSNSAQKKYITSLLIKEAGAKPIQNGRPVAVVMAGIPGSGKTEYLDSMAEELKSKEFRPFVRVDLDQIVTVLPNYTPKTDQKFRLKGIYILSGCIDRLMKSKYDLMIDGTFSGKSGVSTSNIERLINHDYSVILVWMWDTPQSA